MKESLEKCLLYGGEVLDSLNIPFFLVGGTLLGVIRENQLLEHDSDVDVAVLAENINDELIEKLKNKVDYIKIQSNNLEEKPGHIAIKYHQFFDIFPYFKREDKRFENAVTNNCLVWPAHLFEGKPLYRDFLGRKWRVPNPPEQFLETTYGDWKTVVKAYDWHTALNFRLHDKF